MKGIGIIGAGGMGHQHALYLTENKGVQKLGVFDVNAKRAQDFAETFHARCYATLEEMLEDDEIDGVFIVTPPKTHLSLTRQAFEYGKHVFCEKPVASSLEDAEQILQLCKEHSDLCFMIGFPERFNGPNVELKKMIEDGKLGKIKMIRTNTRLSLETYQKEQIPWLRSRKSGGGVILEASIHSWDLMQWIAGSKLKRVHAEGTGELHSGDDIFDTQVVAAGVLENGVLVVNDSTFILPKNSPYDKKLEVFGTDATVSIDYQTQNFRMFSRKPNEVGGGTYDGLFYPDLFWFSHEFGAVKKEQEAFLEAIKDPHHRSLSGASDALDALQAVLAVAAAVDEGRSADEEY